MGKLWDDLSIEIPCLFKFISLSLDMDLIWQLHFSFYKKSSIFDLIFIYRIYMDVLITSVPQLVSAETRLYLMVSNCAYNTRSMQCIQKQKKFIEKAYIPKKKNMNTVNTHSKS